MKNRQTSYGNSLNALQAIITVIMKVADNIIQKAYKFRICEPSKIVQTNLEQTLNLCRDLYNCALQERRDAYKLNRISLNYYDQANQLKEIKETNPEHKGVHSQILQDVLKRLDKTFKAFYSRAKKGQAGFPRFKSQSRFDSFCFPQSGFSLTENKLTLSKIGTVKLKLSRQIIGKVKTLTIKQECGKWFAVFTVATKAEILSETNKAIGLDVGIENFVTLSDGTQIDNWKYFESSKKQLRRAQRKVSRRKKFSNRWRKAVNQVKKIHAHIKNQRADFQHKLSTHLVRQFQTIVCEDLNVKDMSRGILSKQIHDVGWSSFFQKIEYKVANTDRRLIKVNPNYTSQTCLCRHREKKSLAVRWHNCLKCGLSIHRDILSAKIILSLGLSGKDLTKAVGL